MTTFSKGAGEVETSSMQPLQKKGTLIQSIGGGQNELEFGNMPKLNNTEQMGKKLVSTFE